MRKITIYTTQGENNQVVETDVKLWKDLKVVLKQKRISYDNMKAVVGSTRNTLESPEAQLPDGDFMLFLLLKKNKSGTTDPESMTYAELKTAIKNIIAGNAANKDAHKETKTFFANGSKNYTQTGTEYMRKRLIAWFKKSGKKVPVEATARAETVGKAETKKAVKVASPFDKAIKAVDELRESKDFTTTENNTLNQIHTDLVGLAAEIRERMKKEAIEGEADKKAKAEMRDIAKGFNDVKGIY